MLLLDKTSSIETLINRLAVTRLTAALLFLTAILSTAAIPRTHWPLNLVTYSVAVLIFLVMLQTRDKANLRFWIGIGIISRISLLFVFPNLSDDIFRFIWDGRCTVAGINPYGVVPEQWLSAQPGSDVLTSELVEKMNSPGYYTVYPPISQLIFAVAVVMGGKSILFTTTVLKLILLIGELITVRLMYTILQTKGKRWMVLFYALNPLVIIEVVGNVHFEGLMATGFVMAYWSMTKPILNTPKLASIAGSFALGVGVKLLPIAVFPFLWRRIGTKKFLISGTVLAGLLAVVFIPPFMYSDVTGTSSSINLYFQTFEFNASLYYVLRWFGFVWKGYNMIATIGTAMGIVTLLLFLIIFLAERKPVPSTWPRAALFGLSVYFALASIVHPWYVVPLVALSVFTQFRFAIAWSVVVFLSYSAYTSADYTENLVLITVEYLVVYSIAAYELLNFWALSGNKKGPSTKAL